MKVPDQKRFRFARCVEDGDIHAVESDTQERARGVSEQMQEGLTAASWFERGD